MPSSPMEPSVTSPARRCAPSSADRCCCRIRVRASGTSRREPWTSIGREVHSLPKGFYFSIPRYVELNPRFDGYGMAVTRQDFTGFFHVGRIEHEGRLRYIDG